MSWTLKVNGLEEKLSEACEAFDGHDARLEFVQKLPSHGEDGYLRDIEAFQPLQHRRGATMLARLRLPVQGPTAEELTPAQRKLLDRLNVSVPGSGQNSVLTEVNILGPKKARLRFAELVGLAGRLIPSNVRFGLDRYQPAKGRMTARGRFLAYLWLLESTQLGEHGELIWLEVFRIREPFRLARMVLQCFRNNPGGHFELPMDDEGVVDRSAFVVAKPLRDQRGMTAVQCNRFLDRYGTKSEQPVEGKVRFLKPNTKTLLIHSGDWINHWKEVDRQQSDALGEEALQEVIANVEAEKAKVKDERKLRGASSRQVSRLGELMR